MVLDFSNRRCFLFCSYGWWGFLRELAFNIRSCSGYHATTYAQASASCDSAT